MSSINSIGSSAASMMQSMQARKRPDATEVAENLFTKLDTSNQGYIEKSDLQSAFDTISSASTTTTGSVDELFSSIDADSDGKVTQDELASSLKSLSDQLDQQFESGRMQFAGQAGGAGGMPPPPPPAENDSGFTKDELTSQLSEIGSSDSTRSSLISSVVENFDAADTDSDGKVTFKEAMAYQESTESTSSSTATTSTESSESTASTQAKLMQQIMQLMHAYGGTEASGSVASLLSTIA